MPGHNIEINEIHAPTSWQHSSGWMSSWGAHHGLPAPYGSALTLLRIAIGSDQEKSRSIVNLFLWVYTAIHFTQSSGFQYWAPEFAPFKIQICNAARRFCSEAGKTGCWIWDLQRLKKTPWPLSFTYIFYDSLLALKSVTANVVGL